MTCDPPDRHPTDGAVPDSTLAVGRRSDDHRPVLGRARLNPSARILWRATGCVQVELGNRAVVLDGVTTDDLRLLLAGCDDAHLLGAEAMIPLRAAGFMVDSRPTPPRPPAAPRLSSELGGLRISAAGSADQVLRARERSMVRVRGLGRLVATVAALLGAAGIGRVEVDAAGDVTLDAAQPGGVLPTDEGRRHTAAAVEAVRRAAPECVVGAGAPGRPPDLTVAVGDRRVEGELADASTPLEPGAHLMARTAGEVGVVGPLVIAGLTSCLRCADLGRRDRDPAWPILAVQLSRASRHPAPADVCLDTIVAGLTALEALRFLDGEVCEAMNGTLEVSRPQARVRRRSWFPHQDCPCGAYARRRDWAE
jgi:hypothetical protein